MKKTIKKSAAFIVLMFTSVSFATDHYSVLSIEHLQEDPSRLSILAPTSTEGAVFELNGHKFEDINQDGKTDIQVVFRSTNLENPITVAAAFLNDGEGFIYNIPDADGIISDKNAGSTLQPTPAEGFPLLSFGPDRPTEPWTHHQGRSTRPCNPHSWYSDDRCPRGKPDPNAPPYPPSLEQQRAEFAEACRRMHELNQEENRRKRAFKWCNPESYHPPGDKCEGVGNAGNVLRWIQSWFFSDV